LLRCNKSLYGIGMEGVGTLSHSDFRGNGLSFPVLYHVGNRSIVYSLFHVEVHSIPSFFRTFTMKEC
jgi:hypothetical protein